MPRHRDPVLPNVVATGVALIAIVFFPGCGDGGERDDQVASSKEPAAGIEPAAGKSLEPAEKGRDSNEKDRDSNEEGRDPEEDPGEPTGDVADEAPPEEHIIFFRALPAYDTSMPIIRVPFEGKNMKDSIGIRGSAGDRFDAEHEQ